MYEETLEVEQIFSGKVVTLERQRVRLIDGNLSTREIIHHHGGAAVVPVDQNGNVYLIRQYRKALESEILEIPAGKLEENEDPYLCAIRELKEETGMEAKKVESLGFFYPSPGFLDEKIYIYLARDLTLGPQALDPDEFLSVISMPLEDVINAIDEGRIHDAKTVIGLLKTKFILDERSEEKD